MILLIIWLLVNPPALAKDNGQYSQSNPATKDWFKSQRSPKTGVSCCDDSDGQQVTEEIREGEYWVSSDVTKGEFIRVPNDIVLKGANVFGAPVVWWRYEGGKPIPYCYSPGAKG